jgi:hypothetical protein
VARIKEAFVKEVLRRHNLEHISFSRMVELINEEAERRPTAELTIVPYQKCPVCNGIGKIISIPSDTTSLGYQPCHVCNGSGIIPTHIVNEDLLKISSKNYGDDGVGLSSDEITKLI